MDKPERAKYYTRVNGGIARLTNDCGGTHEWEEDDRHHVFQFLSESNGKSAFTGHDNARYKGTCIEP